MGSPPQENASFSKNPHCLDLGFLSSGLSVERAKSLACVENDEEEEDERETDAPPEE